MHCAMVDLVLWLVVVAADGGASRRFVSAFELSVATWLNTDSYVEGFCSWRQFDFQMSGNLYTFYLNLTANGNGRSKTPSNALSSNLLVVEIVASQEPWS